MGSSMRGTGAAHAMHYVSAKLFGKVHRAYANKNNYVKEISFENVIESLILIIEQIILIGTGTGTGKKN